MNMLFEEIEKQSQIQNAPLAERVRPQNINDLIGQEHLIGLDAPIRKFIEYGEIPSIIFWGPPGVGKTTLAQIISNSADYSFSKLSAVESGVKDVREVISKAEMLRKKGRKTLLFIDEIHRFNKSQQDALLNAVEKGTITLIGATTENPSFEVIAPLLSRCQVYRLKALEIEHIKSIVLNAIQKDGQFSNYRIEIEDWNFLYNISAGDARSALNAIDLAFKFIKKNTEDNIIITRKHLEKALQQRTAYYDKKGDSHYDTISAFIKSLRGSDPDAALLWLAKMLDAGEDPRFIARRMVIFASEDISNADPFALTLAISVFQAVELIGMPEAQINLAQAVTYLACSPKSNASYLGLMAAQNYVRKAHSLSVPLHLRNAPTQLMKDEGYGENYKYPHDFDFHFVKENYFPMNTNPIAFYFPGTFGKEDAFSKRMKIFWKERFEDVRD